MEAICISSMFHYYLVEKEKNKFINEKYEEGNTEFLKKNFQGFSGDLSSIQDLKFFLSQNDINCRII